jgi:transcription initiation factor TFIIB
MTMMAPPASPGADFPSAQGVNAVAPAYQENLNIQVMCKDCKEVPANIIESFSTGDMVCGSCGLVFGDRIIDTRSEWRTFSNDDQGTDDPSRVGDAANELLNGNQLHTTIAFGDGAKSRDLHRAQMKSTHDKSAKTLMAAYKEIGAYCDSIQISKSVSDIAKHLFKTVDDAKAFKGKSQEALIAGCIFIACRRGGVGRTFREVFALTKVPKKEIGRTYKQLNKFFMTQDQEKNLKIEQAGGMHLYLKSCLPLILLTAMKGFVNPEETFAPTGATAPASLNRRFSSSLKLSPRIVKVSDDIIGFVEATGVLDGRSPLSFVATCIYAASYIMGDGRTSKDIAKYAGVSDGTIRTSYKAVYAAKDRLFTPEWVKKVGADLSKLPPM